MELSVTLVVAMVFVGDLDESADAVFGFIVSE